jgi:hypothetical protein
VLRWLVLICFTIAIVTVLVRPQTAWGLALILAVMHLFVQALFLVMIW